MKALFGVLLCLVFTASKTFALKGGPAYPPGKNVVGTYAGILQGAFDPTLAGAGSANSIGIFSLGVPATGNGTGAFMMFTRGRTFTGTINANGNLNTGAVRGLLTATYNYTLQTRNAAGDLVSVPITASVNGPLKADVVTSKASTLSASATLLQGTATLSVSQGGIAANGDPVINSTLLLDVDGFKQSNTATARTTP